MTPSRPKIYFIRHGETDWNLEGRLQGQKDIPLNDVGRVQAEEAARKLQGLVPHVEDLAYVASPMIRTRETMEILRKTLGLHPESYRLDERLVELTFGVWEGMTWKEVRKAEPALAALREQDKWHYAPPGGGESYAMLVDRIRPILDDLTRDTVIVAHGGVARAFLSICCGVSSRQAASMDIWQGRVLVIEGRNYRWA
ncbi:histidine phosphatase family protein [Microvirga sp. 3-52]|uniref:histidine phosphatase family protein n=1 Tax=Microvirga sp. 3-52 TaxID=2792425 RepID=UPI001AC41C72|nr:histidine phosphatase family protein [Microvirga sp. 3-52]MBO1904594.1 histidine phosphatase family protein [Microvirga sp. 3-52]MBS7451867.1 histidine phosphatase family protein [Microvirga sp. 3-52]